VIESGQVWRCDEAEADEPEAEPHDVDLWEPLPRFRALVDRVEDDMVELTAATGNTHPRTPAFGADLVKTTETLQEDPRWTRVDGGDQA